MEEARKLFTPENNHPDVYYQFRTEFNQSRIRSAERCCSSISTVMVTTACAAITCGEFNVPFGAIKRPYFPQDELYHFAEKRRTPEFPPPPYEECMELAGVNSVVYCDPPLRTTVCNGEFHRLSHQQLQPG